MLDKTLRAEPESIIFNFNITNHQEYPLAAFARLEFIGTTRMEGDPTTANKNPNFATNDIPINRQHICTITLEKTDRLYAFCFSTVPLAYLRLILYNASGMYEMADFYQPTIIYTTDILNNSVVDSNGSWVLNYDITIHPKEQLMPISQLSDNFRGINPNLWQSLTQIPFTGGDKNYILPYKIFNNPSAYFVNKYNTQEDYWNYYPIAEHTDRDGWGVIGQAYRYLRPIQVTSKIEYQTANGTTLTNVTGGTITLTADRSGYNKFTKTYSGGILTMYPVPIGADIKLIAEPLSGYTITENVKTMTNVGADINNTITAVSSTFIAKQSSSVPIVTVILLPVKIYNISNYNDYSVGIRLKIYSREQNSSEPKELLTTVSCTMDSNPGNRTIEAYNGTVRINSAKVTKRYYGEIESVAPVKLEDTQFKSHDSKYNLILTSYEKGLRQLTIEIISSITGWDVSTASSKLSTFDTSTEKKLILLSSTSIITAEQGYADLANIGAESNVEKVNSTTGGLIWDGEQKNLDAYCYVMPVASGRSYTIEVRNASMKWVNTDITAPSGVFTWEITNAQGRSLADGVIPKTLPYDISFIMSRWCDVRKNLPNGQTISKTFTLEKGKSSGTFYVGDFILDRYSRVTYFMCDNPIEMVTPVSSQSNQMDVEWYTSSRITIGKDTFNIKYNQ
mgnify:FL=1